MDGNGQGRGSAIKALRTSGVRNQLLQSEAPVGAPDVDQRGADNLVPGDLAGGNSISDRKYRGTLQRDKLYFNRWLENPEYRDEVVIRQYSHGENLEVIPGALYEMPDGQRWRIRQRSALPGLLPLGGQRRGKLPDRWIGDDFFILLPSALW